MMFLEGSPSKFLDHQLINYWTNIIYVNGELYLKSNQLIKS